MRLLLALLPWLELFTLVQLGIETSALTAVAYVFVTLFLGLALMRRQGENLFMQMGQGGPVAARLLVDDMAMGFAGLLLVIPGLITDFAAIIVLVGPLRRRIVALWQGADAPAVSSVEPRREGDTLEGEYHRVDHPKDP